MTIASVGYLLVASMLPLVLVGSGLAGFFAGLVSGLGVRLLFPRTSS